jgi:hypothetical protein
MSQIVPMILDKIVDGLTPYLQPSGEDESFPTYANILKKGLLQYDKSKKMVGLGVQSGNREDPNYRDGIVALDDFDNIGIQYREVAREIGGSELWWRRGTIEQECFYVGPNRLSEAEAYDAAFEVQSRILQYLPAINMAGVEDSHGEHAIKIYAFGTTLYESGGLSGSNLDSILFRGKVFWACLTERP